MTALMPPVMIYIQKVTAAHRIFQSVLGSATPDKVFDDKAVTISEDGKWLYEHTGHGRVLAEAVLGVDFPREAGPIELDHYTSLAGLNAIATSAQLHLHPVAKRLHEDEFATFAREHDLQGYSMTTDAGRKSSKSFPRIYFTFPWQSLGIRTKPTFGAYSRTTGAAFAFGCG